MLGEEMVVGYIISNPSNNGEIVKWVTTKHINVFHLPLFHQTGSVLVI